VAARLHTSDEDRNYYRSRIFGHSEVWGAEEEGAVKGFTAFHGEWIDQFYVLPEAQRRGLGSALLQIAKQRLRAFGYGRFSATCRPAVSMRRAVSS
jgi:GNAT superfamily N-acetyltransferase